MLCIRIIVLALGLHTLINVFLLTDANNEFAIRLEKLDADGLEGRVEVFRRGERAGIWGNICDNSWDEKDAIVACRQLGFKNVGYPVDGRRTALRYGSGKDVEYFYTDFKCNGSEDALRNCPYTTYTSEHNCIPDRQAAGLMCSADFDLRLSGKSATEGILQIFYNGDWTDVRSEDFDDKSANVACMQVQDDQDQRHTDGIIVDPSRYGNDVGSCQFSNFDCHGNETNIKDCDFTKASTKTGCTKLVAIRCDDPCSISPCKNGGLCETTAGGGVICHCKSGFSGELCTIGTVGISSGLADINTLEFETIILVTTFGLIGFFLLLTLLTTIISRFAFQHALQRIIFEADKELESQDPDGFERHVIGDEEYYEEKGNEAHVENDDGDVEGVGVGEKEYEWDHEKSMGNYDERFEGSCDVNSQEAIDLQS
ncbi:uncharacterized protein [Antedon mediterranea]|uniref:uncharacterized protein n=1 Tax=Antedon mediterranea TaxID=105859 RepID=UPI003AF7E461